MEGMFRQLGIYSSRGQLYEPADSGQVMYYREDASGQVMEEGINEGGAFAAWLAAATAYSNHDCTLIPFYIFYSMFGFQRVGDLCWAAGDLQARGFLIGGTSGRTTLNGEGLQHQDGHSHVLAATIPNLRAYDPTYAYELAVIIQHGLQVMYSDRKSVFYYITVMNENYSHAEMPKGVEEGITRGMYLLERNSKPARKGSRKSDSADLTVQLLGSGSILREVLAAAAILKTEFNIFADIWSVTSFTELRREALAVSRWNMLHPKKAPRRSYVTKLLGNTKGPVIASTDYMKIHADQIREYVPGAYRVLGTDGFGRSDTRAKLRYFFEIDRYFIVVAALTELVEAQELAADVVVEAMKKYDLSADKPDPCLT